MKTLFQILLLTFLAVSCGQQQKHGGPPYEQLKPQLNLSGKQAKYFDEITQRYNATRAEAFAEARAGGKMDREAMLAKMKQLFAAQDKELGEILNNEQFALYSEWIAANIPGRVGWTPELVNQIKTELQLDAEKGQMIDAANEAFIEAYMGAHDHYHGNNEAAKQYWTEFNNSRNEAIKSILSAEQYARFLEITKDVRFKGEHGNAKK